MGLVGKYMSCLLCCEDTTNPWTSMVASPLASLTLDPYTCLDQILHPALENSLINELYLL